MFRKTLSLISAFSIASIVSLSPAFAQSNPADGYQPEIRNYGLITPPVCTTEQGETIQHYAGTSEQIVQFGGFLAAAGDFEVGKNGGIVNEDRIYYDETNMPYLHPLFQEFLFHHECAHVQLSHLDIPINQRQSQYFPIEQGADCAAFQEIKEDSDDFAADAALILSNFRYIANTIMPAAPGKEGVREQFVDQRIENMLACPALQN